MLSRTRTLALAWITVLLAAPAAHAQDIPPENIAAARSLGIEGVKLANEGNCAAAMEKLARAEALYHAPTILGRLGECQVEVGQIVLGTENLNRVVREQLAPDAPRAFVEAQARAKKVLNKALPRIAFLVIRVTPPEAQPSVTVGDAAVPPALIGAPRPTDPGTSTITVTAPGYMRLERKVTLAEGERQEVALTLMADQAAQAPPTAPPPQPVPAEPPPPPPPPEGKSNTLAYVMLGAGAAGLAVGGVTGLMAISKKGSLECPENRCPPDQHDSLDSANSLALISTIGFGVGVVGVALGGVFLLSGGESSEPAPSALSAEPYLGVREVGVLGRF